MSGQVTERSTTTRRTPARLRKLVTKETVRWSFEGSTFEIPLAYHRMSCVVEDAFCEPALPPRDGKYSADLQHILTVTLDLGESELPDRAIDALETLLCGPDRAVESPRRWEHPGRDRDAPQVAIATLTVGEYWYTDGIGSLMDILDGEEGDQANGAGAAAVAWLEDQGADWLETDFVTPHRGAVQYFRNLTVHPCFAGQGVATRLMAWAMVHLAGPCRETTSILAAMPEDQNAEGHKDVDRLVDLYASVGFREIRSLREDGEAAVMVHHSAWGYPWDTKGGFYPPISARRRPRVTRTPALTS